VASPIAHSLTAVVIYAVTRRRGDPGHRSWELWWLLLAANLADLDLIPSILLGDHSLFHRTFSHSLPACVLVGALVYAVGRWLGRADAPRLALLTTIAYASQLLLDWMSFDPGPVSGIPLLWPFSQEHFMAAPTVFLNIERDDWLTIPVILHNAQAAALEIAVLGPLAALAWWWRRRGPRDAAARRCN